MKNFNDLQVGLMPVALIAFTSWAGYIVFHGHLVGKDCWLCQYRGLAFIGIPVGWWLYLLHDDEED